MPATNPYDAIFRSAGADIFSMASQVAAMLEVEAALASVEGKLGVIPPSAASAIVSRCHLNFIDLKSVAAESARAGNIAIPVVKLLTASVSEESREDAGFVHWGATSQDILDTALVLQLRKHLHILSVRLDELCKACAALAENHIHTILPGRTWLQQAVPTTFGLKAAGWLDAFLRHRTRLQELRPRILALQFGGASGTLASLGARGAEVAAALALELGLELPSIPWHSHRDRVAEVASFHGLLTGTLGKIGRDVSLSMQTEIAELSEPTAIGRGGSSTMPHKRNPVGSAVLLAAAMRVPGLVSTMLSAMVQEHERGLGGWQAEWETLPEICTLTLGALDCAVEFIPGLTIDAESMRRNLERSGGLYLAEAISIRLAETIGRDRAHVLVEQAAHRSIDEHISFIDAVLAVSEITATLDGEAVRALLQPENYLGAMHPFVHAVLAEYRAAFHPRSEAS